MLQTAEQGAKRYNIPRQRMDDIRRGEQQKATAAKDGGRFDAEMTPVTTLAGVADAQPGPAHEGSHHHGDEGHPAGNDLRRHQGHQAGDSRRRDLGRQREASSATAPARWWCMNEKLAEQRGLIAARAASSASRSAGCEPDEMGIGPVFAVPKVLEAPRPAVADIDLWELNEAFAVQVLYGADKRHPDDKLNVDGGAIAVGHPYASAASASPATRSSKASAAAPSASS
jgi:acetyl-CoA C-acetyltransferase